MSDGVQVPPAPPPGMQLPQALALIAEHEQDGRLDEAEVLLARVRDIAPDHPHAAHLGGILAWRRGRIEDARSLMERSIALAPGTAPYPRNICEGIAPSAATTRRWRRASALGRPAWLLLAHAPDWRWMAGGEDTPWYPSLRLFRQSAPRGWPELAGRVARELERAASA